MVLVIDLATGNNSPRTVGRTDTATGWKRVEPFNCVTRSMYNHKLGPHAVRRGMVHCSVPLFDCPNESFNHGHVFLSCTNVYFQVLMFLFQTRLDRLEFRVSIHHLDPKTSMVVLREGGLQSRLQGGTFRVYQIVDCDESDVA